MLTQTFRTTDDAEGTPRAFTLIHYSQGAPPLCILHDGVATDADGKGRPETTIERPDGSTIVPPVALNPAAWKAMRDAQPSWPVAAWNALVEAARRVADASA